MSPGNQPPSSGTGTGPQAPSRAAAGLLALLAWFLAPAHHACGDAVIDVGLHLAPEGVGSAAVRVPVAVLGGESVTDMVGAIQIGDGGPLVGGTPAPEITGLDLDGTIWASAPGGFVEFTASSAPPAQIVDPSVSLLAGGETVAATGTLLTLTIDASSFPPGDYPIRFSGTEAGDTTLLHRQDEIPATIINGTLRIVPAKEWWQDANFPDSSDNPFLEDTIWGDLADPDEDGRRNIEEFLFGTNPNLADHPSVSDSAPGFPTVTVNGDSASLVISRRREATPSATLEVEASLDLDTWSNEEVTGIVLGEVGSGEFERVAFLYTGPHPDRVFFRTLVTPAGSP